MGSRLRFTAFTLLGVGVGTYLTTKENQILKEVNINHYESAEIEIFLEKISNNNTFFPLKH